MILIPAIDLIDGKCVRLTQGDYTQKKVYNEHPLEVALQFEAAGLSRLHLVDLDGAKAGRVVNQKVLEQLASQTNLTIDFGGGIKTNTDIQKVYDAGATIATIGSIAVKQPERFHGWIRQYGADKILLGADVKGETIAIHGWTEETTLNIYDFLGDQMTHGLRQAFCTDIAKDGLLAGPSLHLYKKIINRFGGLAFIASGGISSLEDLDALKAIGCEGAIIGKAIYEGRITIAALAEWQQKNSAAGPAADA